MTIGCLNHTGPRGRACTSCATRSTSSRGSRTSWSTSTAAPPTPLGAVAARPGFSATSASSKIQGFFLNSTHFDWTSREIRYGEADLTDDRRQALRRQHLRERSGPAEAAESRVRQGNEILCNPPGRGLGPQAHVRHRLPERRRVRLDRLSGAVRRSCRPGAPNGVFWPSWALELVRNADFSVR